MKNYQAKKKKLSKQVFEILKVKGYLLLEEERRHIESGEYRTTLATNFDSITQAIKILRNFPQMGHISVNYDDFSILKNQVLFTVKPRITGRQIDQEESDSETSSG